MRNCRVQLCRRVGKSAKIIQSKLVNFVRCIAVVVVATELREHNLVAFACVLIMFSIVMMTNNVMCWATKQFSFEEVACNYAQFVDVCVSVCTNTYLLL